METLDVLSELYDTIDDAILVINSNYEVEKINRKGKELFGEINEDVSNLKCYDLICHSKSPSKQCPLHCMKEGEFSSDDYIIERKGHTYSINTKEITMENGDSKYIEVLHDISKYNGGKQLQKEIREEYLAINEEYQSSLEELENKNKQLEIEKSRYKLLFSNMNSAFAYHQIILDKKGKPIDYKFLECNNEFEKQTGLKRKNIIGKTVLEVLPNTEKIWIENYGKVALTGEPYNFTSYAQELGKYYETRSYSPQKGYFVVTFIDVTQRFDDQKRLEALNAELKQSLEDSQQINIRLEETLETIEAKENILQTVFNNAPSIMLLVDENAEIIQLNRAGLEMSGKDNNQVVGLGGGDVLNCIGSLHSPKGCGFGEICHNCTIRQIVLDTITTGNDHKKVQAEISVKNKNGNIKRLDLLVSSSVVKDIDRKQVLVTVQDVTNLLEHERLLKKQNKQIQNLFDGAKSVLELDDFEKTARKLFNYCKEITGATSGYVALLNEKGEENEVLFLDAGGLPCTVDESLPMPVRGVREEAYRLGKAVLHNNFMESEHVKFMPKGHVILKNVLFAPLMINNKGVGLIGLANKPSNFTQNDLELVSAFGELASIALNNSRTKEQLEKYNSELIEREEKYRALYENAPLAYQSLDIDGNIKDINPQWLKILGYERHEVIGKWFGDFLHPQIVPRFKEKFEQFKKAGVTHDVRFSLRKKEGAYIDVSFEGCIGYTPEGAFKQTYCTFKDITKEQQANKELVKSQQTYQRLVDNMYDLVCELDEEGKFTFANNRYEEVMGYTPEYLIDKYAFDFMHPDDLKNGLEAFKEVLEQETDAVYQWRFKRQDGTYGLFECKSTTFKDHNNRLRTIVISQDITELKKQKKQLEEQKIMFETMFNTINEGVVITNTKREIVLANKGMETTFGYKPDEVIGKSTKILYAGSDHFKNTGNKIFNEDSKNDDSEYVTYYVDKNNRVFPGETFGSKLYDSYGEWIGNVGVMRDITERRNIIEELKNEKERAEKADRLKSAFLANMSHEIRTPLNGIMGFSNIIATKNDMTESQRKMYADIIDKSSENLLRIVNDILDISALENKSMEIAKKNVEINTLLDAIYRVFVQKMLQTKPKLQLRLHKNETPLIINTDGSRVSQIITNLLDNALKFTHEGAIEFGIKSIKEDQLLFFVEDTGIGIETSKIDVIFDRFRQAVEGSNRIYGGNGLGLSITKELLKLLGGDVRVESEIGKGTCFYFTLPYQKNLELLSEGDKEESNEKSGPVKLKILVVEDDQINALYLQELLEELEAEITLVDTGKKAIEKTKQNKFNAILMDIRLPDMDGFEATKEIRKFNTEIPILAQTAYAMKTDEEMAYAVGCSDYISKPISKDLLFKKLSVSVI